MKTFKCLEHFLFIGMCIINIKALSDKEKNMIIAKVALATLPCIQESPINLDDIQSFRIKKHPEGENVKCFSACILKKTGMMDEKGLLSMDGARSNAKQIFQGEDKEDYFRNVEGIMTKCIYVNTQITKDGEKGCDRAKLAYECFITNAAQFGFEFQF